MKCLLENWTGVEKRIKAICKKLDKYGIHYEYSRQADTIEKVKVYKTVEFVGSQFIGTYPIDVVNYDFHMDTLKLGDWLAVAVIEHNVTDDNKNMVYMLDAEQPLLSDWTTIKGNCEHCNSKRSRNKTVILKDQSGNFKQVGTSCVKDFTGIDGIDILKAYTELHDIFIADMTVNCADDRPYASKYVNTAAFLARCIDEILKAGYTKDFTKENALDAHFQRGKYINGKQTSEKAITEATKVLEFFRQFDSLDDVENEFGFSGASFYWNIAMALNGEYCKPNGFIAYAYVSYQKAIEAQIKRKSEAEQRGVSQHQYSIGEKIKLELIYTRSVAFENSYNGGYSATTSYFHFFQDKNGNVYKWSTAKCIEATTGENIIIAGTVKAHDEYNTEKQTVLTRCKIA